MEKLERLIQNYKAILIDALDQCFNNEHFVLVFALSIGLIILELFFTGWKNSSLKKIIDFKPSTRVDFTAWLIESINFYAFLSLTFSFGLCYYLAGIIQNSFDFNLTISNSFIQISVIIVAGDFKNWLSHYLFHKSNSLWQLHSFHHAATSFNILTRQRGHLLESEIKRFFDVIPYVIFGAPITTYLLISILTELHQMLLHSSSNSEWGFLGRNIIVSPASHKVHHSIDPAHFNKNFGVIFIFWDKLFKTYHPKTENIVLGIPNNPYNRGYFRDMMWGQWLFFNTLYHSTKRRVNRFKNRK